MATYGEGFTGTSRPDLGPIASAYLMDYGARPDSLNGVGLFAPTPMPVKQSGVVFVPSSEVALTSDAATHSFLWPVNQPYPEPRKSTSYTTLTVNLNRYGQEEIWDEEDDESVIYDSAENEGPLTSETYHLTESLNALCEGTSRKLLNTLNATSTPWSYTDTDCTATKWTAATTAIRTQLQTAMAKAPWRSFDACIMDNTAWKAFKAASELWSSFSYSGVGQLNDQGALSALQTMTGVSQLFIYDDALDSAADVEGVVTLFKRGANAKRDPSGIVMGYKRANVTPAPGVDYRPGPVEAVNIKSRSVGYGHGIVAYAWISYNVVGAHGLRLINVHA